MRLVEQYLTEHANELHLPTKLYGRERSLATMVETFDRVSRGGGEVLLVPGYSGVGKTSLVQELETPIARRNGYFCQGKFNQFQQNVPYYAVQQVMAELANRIMEEDEATRSHWRTRLLNAIGDVGQLLIDLAPEFGSILGPQPPVAAISPQEARHRFITIFQKMLTVFCRPEHPLVFFIDDWQWADAASLELLGQLGISETLRYFLVIAAYRDNEVDANHPFSTTVVELRQKGVPIRVQRVTNLDRSVVEDFVHDALPPRVEGLAEFTDIVHDRTGGNPFFMHAFLSFIHETGRLRYDGAAEVWRWSGDKDDREAFPDDVVDLFFKLFRRRDPDVQQLLSMAACLGNRFSLDTLALVADKDREACFALLAHELQKGVLVDLHKKPGNRHRDTVGDRAFKFVHDRVQQAAHGLMDPAALPEVKLAIGRKLLKHLDEEKLAGQLFSVVDHLNAGIGLVFDPEERLRVVEMNVAAARKAKAATAYAAALEFHRAAGRALDAPGMREHLWGRRHELAMELFMEWAETEFLEGDKQTSEEHIHTAVAHARTTVEKAEAQRILIVQHTLQARYPEAIEAAREGLAALGVEMPEGDYEASRDREFARMKSLLEERTVESFFGQPEMSDPEMRKATQLLITMGPPCYRSHQRLWAVLVPTAVNLMLQYGNMPQAGYSHTAFAGLSIWGRGDFTLAREFMDLAIDLMTQTFDAPADQSVFYLMVGSSARHWFHHLRSSSQDYADAYDIGSRFGNLQYAAYAFGHNMYCRFYQGGALAELREESEQSLQFSRTRHNQWAIDLLEGGMAIMNSLSGKRSAEELLEWEAAYRGRLAEHRNIQVECIYNVMRAFQLLVMDECEAALTVSDKAAEIIYTVGTQGLLPWPEHLFARFLILTRLYAHATPARRATWDGELRAIHGKLMLWAHHCADNYGFKLALAEAELATLHGRPEEAMCRYEEAVEGARNGGFTQWEGMANERAALFWEGHGQGATAQVYWQQAYSCYDSWGAGARLKALEDLFAKRLEQPFPASRNGQAETPSRVRTLLMHKQKHILRSTRLQAEESFRRQEAERQAEELARATARLREEVAHRKKMERTLRESEERFRLTFDKSPIGAALLTLDGRFFRVNETLSAMLGYTEEELGELTYLDITHPEDKPESARVSAGLFREGKGRYRLEKRYLCKDGAVVWTKVSVSILRDQERLPLYALSMVEDVTERKKAQEELLQAKEEAQAASKAKSVFLANMSHEIRTPLNGVMGMLQLMQTTSMSEEQQEYAATALRSSRRLNRLLSDILDLSKVEVGRLEIRDEPFDCKEALETLTQLFAPMARSKGVELRVSADPALPTFVQGDSMRLQQVLGNLVGNAIKFTQAGYVELAATPIPPVHTDTPRVLFTISDTGIGIPSDKLDHLFEAFIQAESDYRRRFQGAGLGLAISRQIISLMGGAISVDSAEGEGTQFYVCIPLSTVEPPESRKHVEKKAGPVKGLHILLAEDDKVSRLTLRRLLQKQGNQVTTVENGKQALDALAAEPFDVVFMDVQMPVMDGMEATRAIRNGEAGEDRKGTPIIAVTAYAMNTDKERFLAAGMDGYVAKPAEVRTVREVLDQVMHDRDVLD